MQKELDTKINIPESLFSIYQEMAVSPLDLLKKYALSMIRDKIVKYESEDRNFQKKYTCDFEQFRDQIEVMDNEENFEWEDDLLDWEFAVTNLKLWRKKEQAVNY